MSVFKGVVSSSATAANAHVAVARSPGLPTEIGGDARLPKRDGQCPFERDSAQGGRIAECPGNVRIAKTCPRKSKQYES